MRDALNYQLLDCGGRRGFSQSYVENNITKLARTSSVTVLSRLNESLIMLAVSYGPLSIEVESLRPILETVRDAYGSVFLSQARASEVFWAMNGKRGFLELLVKLSFTSIL